MAICGPKLSLVGVILSAWGIVQLVRTSYKLHVSWKLPSIHFWFVCLVNRHFLRPRILVKLATCKLSLFTCCLPWLVKQNVNKLSLQVASLTRIRGRRKCLSHTKIQRKVPRNFKLGRLFNSPIVAEIEKPCFPKSKKKIGMHEITF